MRTKLASLALAGAVGVTGAVSATMLSPAISSAAGGAAAAASDRAGRIADALSGLVSDGTITQAQADKVATTLDEAMPKPDGPRGRRGHGGFGGREAAAAEALGLSGQELRTQLEAGKTLGQIADAKGVSRADLVGELVAAAKKQLAEAVTADRLTQAQADERAEGLTERITAGLDKVRTRGAGHGHRPGGGRSGDAPATPPDDSSTAPSSYTA